MKLKKARASLLLALGGLLLSGCQSLGRAFTEEPSPRPWAVKALGEDIAGISGYLETEFVTRPSQFASTLGEMGAREWRNTQEFPVSLIHTIRWIVGI